MPMSAQTRQTKTDTNKVQQLIEKEFEDVLSDTLKATPMKTPTPMKIHLYEGKIWPKRVSAARLIPRQFIEEADKTTQDLVERKVITRVHEPTMWCSPAFFVPKNDNVRVRLVTDYTQLNRYVKRPVHPFPSAKEIIQCIPASAKVFAKLDAVHGYFQLALDRKSSFLTTFLLPSGRYRYLRAPMGLSASSDEWCSSSDVIITGLPWAKKIVDDTIIWADTFEQLLKRVRIVMERCRKYNITISKKKLEIAEKITFAGFVISENGISPDPEQTKAISNFPAPKNVSELRSFLGMVNQLAFFAPDLAQMTAKMRQLLKTKNDWLWLPEHQHELERMKSLLTSSMVVKPFDPALTTILLTDASRLNGLGYALVQKEEDRLRLIICGSCSLTDAQTRYATVELECLAIQWAVKKCNYYLRGLPHFDVYTDHRPLEGLFRKDLHDLDNPRLQRIREKLLPYSFTVTWVEGKTHFIADALSRSPVFEPEEDVTQEIEAMTRAITYQDPALDEITDKTDMEYKATIKALKEDADVWSLPQNHPAKQYSKVWRELSIINHKNQDLMIYQGDRIVIPGPAITSILTKLHIPHAGYTKTRKTACDHYYWPGMHTHIAEMVDACHACTSRRPAIQNEPMKPTKPSDTPIPMSHVGTDLFDCAGQKWLIMVDRTSGFTWTKRLRQTDTNSIISTMKDWFYGYGWPTHIRSDGGPQYRTEFNEFCKQNNIIHELSSPYNPQSNGLAESAVKSVKALLAKCLETREDFEKAHSQFRNTNRADGFSPAEIFFNRTPRSLLPTLQKTKDLSSAMQAKDNTTKKYQDYFNMTAKPATVLAEGSDATMVNMQTEKWDIPCTIIKIREHGNSYIVQTPDGKTYTRNRRHLRPRNKLESNLTANKPSQHRQDGTTKTPLRPNAEIFVPRRSSRIQQQQKTPTYVHTRSYHKTPSTSFISSKYINQKCVEVETTTRRPPTATQGWTSASPSSIHMIRTRKPAPAFICSNFTAQRQGWALQ